MSKAPPKTTRAEVAETLHRSVLRLLRRLRKVDDDLGLSTARLSALSVLVFVGPQSVGSLAEIEQVSQPTMTSLTQRLIRGGYVRVELDPKDRRIKRLIATAKGKKLLERGRRNRLELLSSMLEALPDADVQLLSRSAATIESLLGP